MKSIITHLPTFILTGLFLSLLLPNGVSQSELIRKEKKGKWGFVKKEGKKEKKVIDFQFDKVGYFKNGLCAVQKEEQWGYINETGQVVIPIMYDDAGRFSGTSTYVKTGDKYGLINQLGVAITPIEFDTILHGTRFFLNKKDGAWGLLDSLGQEVQPNIYSDANGRFKDKYFCVKKDGQWISLVDGQEDLTVEPVFATPEFMPKYPGCEDPGNEEEWKACSDKKMLTKVYRTIRYPALARETGVQGVVVISFIITKEGKVTEAEIVREIGAGCGAECLRVVNTLSDWIPAQHDGKIVATRFN